MNVAYTVHIVLRSYASHVTSHHITSQRTISHHITSHHITYITSCLCHPLTLLFPTILMDACGMRIGHVGWDVMCVCVDVCGCVCVCVRVCVWDETRRTATQHIHMSYPRTTHTHPVTAQAHSTSTEHTQHTACQQQISLPSPPFLSQFIGLHADDVIWYVVM